MKLPDWLEGPAIRRVKVGPTISYSRVGLSKIHPAISYVTIRYTPIVNYRWFPQFLGGRPPITYWRFQVDVHMVDKTVHQYYDIGVGEIQLALEQAAIQSVRSVLELLREKLLAA